MRNRFETLEPRRVRGSDAAALPAHSRFRQTLNRCDTAEIAVYRMGLVWRLKGGPGPIDLTVLDISQLGWSHLQGAIPWTGPPAAAPDYFN